MFTYIFYNSIYILRFSQNFQINCKLCLIIFRIIIYLTFTDFVFVKSLILQQSILFQSDICDHNVGSIGDTDTISTEPLHVLELGKYTNPQYLHYLHYLHPGLPANLENLENLEFWYFKSKTLKTVDFN